VTLADLDEQTPPSWANQICNDCARLIEENEWCVPSEKTEGVPGWVCKQCFDQYVAIITRRDK
jgi:hypothetical protein